MSNILTKTLIGQNTKRMLVKDPAEDVQRQTLDEMPRALERNHRRPFHVEHRMSKL